EPQLGAIAAALRQIDMPDRDDIVFAVELAVIGVDGDDDSRLEVGVALRRRLAGDEAHQALFEDRLRDLVGLGFGGDGNIAAEDLYAAVLAVGHLRAVAIAERRSLRRGAADDLLLVGGVVAADLHLRDLVRRREPGAKTNQVHRELQLDAAVAGVALAKE